MYIYIHIWIHIYEDIYIYIYITVFVPNSASMICPRGSWIPAVCWLFERSIAAWLSHGDEGFEWGIPVVTIGFKTADNAMNIQSVPTILKWNKAQTGGPRGPIQGAWTLTPGFWRVVKWQKEGSQTECFSTNSWIPLINRLQATSWVDRGYIW